MTQAFTTEDRRRFTIVALLMFIDGLLLPFAPFQFEWASLVPVGFATALLIALGIFYRCERPAERIAAMTMGTATLLLFTASLATMNYLVAGFDRPLFDARLADWDRALGLDWLATLEAVRQVPGAMLGLGLAYASSLPQVAAVVVILGLTGRTDRLNVTLLALFTGAIISVVAWAAFPSFGALHFYVSAGLQVPDAGLIVDRNYIQHLDELRLHQLRSISLDQLHGLIAFPSFHTVMAVIAAYALFPIRWVGAAALGLNILVIASVPIQGGHHFVDVPAGILVAAVSIVLARRLVNAKVSGVIGSEIPSTVGATPWQGGHRHSASAA